MIYNKSVILLSLVMCSFFAQAMEHRENVSGNDLQASKEKLKAAKEELNGALARFFYYLGQVDTNQGPQGPLDASASLIEIQALLRLKEASLNLGWSINRSLITRNLNTHYRLVLKAAFSVGMLQMGYVDLLLASWQQIQEELKNSEKTINIELAQSITERLEGQKEENKQWRLLSLKKIAENMQTASVFAREELGIDVFYDLIATRGLEEVYRIEEDMQRFFSEHFSSPTTAEAIRGLTEEINSARQAARNATRNLEEVRAMGEAMRRHGLLQEKSSCIFM